MVSAGGDLGEGGASERWGEKADGVEQHRHGGTRAREIEGSAKNSDRARALSAIFPDKRLMGCFVKNALVGALLGTKRVLFFVVALHAHYQDIIKKIRGATFGSRDHMRHKKR
jgi:hypothetical protein